MSAAAVAMGLLLGGWASSAWAWGDAGHQIICELAFQELNTKARQEVVRLIGLDERFETFSDSCIWPDDPRKRNAEHYVNVPRRFGRFSGMQCPRAFRCVLTAIRRDREILRTSGSDIRRLESLKFLGRWVGDIHQPLHISFNDDRGGGKIRGEGACQTNLHSVWDTCMLTHTLGIGPQDIAQSLLDEILDEERASWRAAPVHEWANESLEIARGVSVGYCVRDGSKCIYAPGRETFTGHAERTVTVDAAYLSAHGPIVAERLKRAGVRLGHLLNQVLGQ